jgi:hypothetical protein
MMIFGVIRDREYQAIRNGYCCESTRTSTRKQEIEDIGILKRREVTSVVQYTKYQNYPEL